MTEDNKLKEETEVVDEVDATHKAERSLVEDEAAVAQEEQPLTAVAEEPPSKKSFDDLLVVLGEFGRYQRRVYFFLFLPTIFSAMHKLAWVFLGAQADHRCLLPEEDPEEADYALGEEQRDRFVWNNGTMDQCLYLAAAGTREERECDHGYAYDR